MNVASLPNRAFHPPSSHPAVCRAARRLVGAGGVATDEALAAADVVVGTAADLNLEPLPERTFRIFLRGDQSWVIGDRPRSVLAGALYWLHHARRGAPPSLPLTRTSPYRDRMILEDFPFACYAPTGVDFDETLYAENLVALGYTSMECNRFSRREPRERWFDAFQATNPSPSRFVWTRWHEGVWDREIVAANAAELRACIELAKSFDLEPGVTVFLPRPYSETFFGKHPHLRGPRYLHGYLGLGGHPDQYSIDTDHPDGLAFYEAVFDEWVKANPDIRHYFFWHGDLGAQFWKDGEGPRKRRQMDRILEFHGLLDRVFGEHGTDPKVWVNPWAMREDTLDELNHSLPSRVGYVTKDNPGAIHFNGTARFRMIDSTVTTADIGDIAQRVKALAETSGRSLCFGQYHDFSEDLDPILGAVHPLMTYRKLENLKKFAPTASCTEWGVLSPDLAACRVNQDVLREVIWGVESSCLSGLLPLLLPADLNEEARCRVLAAWRKIDAALQLWPQYWGMRFQGCGVRQRWLVKPLLPPFMALPEDYHNRLVDRQLYRYNARNIYREFMDLSSLQARELAGFYSDMIELLHRAESLLDEAMGRAAGDSADWIANQLPPTRWMRIFWTSFRSQFLFHADAPEDALTGEQRQLLRDEIENTREAIALLEGHPHSLIIADHSWPQCFGPDLAEDFRLKLGFMEGVLVRYPS